MSAGRDRSAPGRTPQRTSAQAATAVPGGGSTPVAVAGLATGVPRGTDTPGTSDGDHLLAHVPQRGREGSAQGPVVGAAHHPAEAAADPMAAVRRLRRQSARVAGTSVPVVQAEPSGPAGALAPLRRQAERTRTAASRAATPDTSREAARRS